MSDHELHLGDAGKILCGMDSCGVDSLVTDPPAGIGFMGKDWDDYRRSHNPADVSRDNVFGRASRVAPEIGRARGGFRAAMQPIFEECLRVLKPGAHGLVWALPRTAHWTATALEDAGFAIRDVGVHLFGTGFPKSLNLDGGMGTALKPAAEHWILCRKPLEGTVAANVLAHGTGALNVDGCRIGLAADEDAEKLNARSGGERGFAKAGEYVNGTERTGAPPPDLAKGRWPANLTLSEEAAALLIEQRGELVSGEAHVLRRNTMKFRNLYSPMRGQTVENGTYGDRGGASRFFYVAKPDRSERDIGCDDLPTASGGDATDRKDGSAGLNNPRAGAGRRGGARNIHPTVKPVDLMRWLCRLITPRGGLVLDPFMGSGTTGVACAREGFRFIGIEREAQYMEIAKRRIRGDAPLLNRPKMVLP